MPLPQPAPGTLKWWIIGTIGIGGGIALAIWFGLSATLGVPTWETLGSKPIDDQTVMVKFQVTRPAGQPMTCQIRALALDFSTVGSAEVKVPQSPNDTSEETVTVRTTTRAVAGQVRSCTMP
ncbi:MAG: DUF4307 domain-containing protein [Intrasporangium sp.]|uniref:DUF4307 domain-containing protein n=1 Tax=Intrasporangium sp. TaxID=1925024 RepID=UPI00264A01E6|nr:DUF4307 domain-containing protein [Intrasporangium sp.]MDN5796966.1 DUF4307 domain-containing protein [Intrasporangium sp.]